MEYHFRIKRFNPEQDPKPFWQDYTVDVAPDDRVLDGLLWIKTNVDGTLTFRHSCAHGVCGSDAMIINGRTHLACKLLMKEASQQQDPITVEAMRSFPVIKDMVVDLKLFFEKYRAIQPYLINDQPIPEKERLQSQQERDRFDDATKCILCGACTGSCPTYWANKTYTGPATIVQAHRFIFDSRDTATEDRLKLLGEAGGVFTCRSIYNCAEACPRGIDVVRAINEVRHAILVNKR
jgi:succinate dehydrogenase / fumarate reductase, iron-sulfur subunit